MPPLVQYIQEDLELALANAHNWSQKRIDIDREIRERQEKWRRIESQPSSTPPEDPPPPTRM